MLVLALFKSQGTPLQTQRVTWYNKHLKTGFLRPESSLPTDWATVQHSLRAYLPLQECLVLKSMSEDLKVYSWYLTSGGVYEPIQSMDSIASMNLIKLASCICAEDCTTRQCYCKNNKVKCISVCGTCHGNQGKNNDDGSTDTNDG